MSATIPAPPETTAEYNYTMSGEDSVDCDDASGWVLPEQMRPVRPIDPLA